MDNLYEISIIICNYNHDKWIERSIRSLLHQQHIQKNEFEIIIIDDCSFDNSEKVLKKFKKFDKACLVIKDNPKIYGQSNILNEIIKMQYKTGCSDVVYIDEDLSDKEMAALFKASDVVVHPYRAEGFGMHVQEAVASGCLPILPDKGPHEDFIPNDVGLRIQTNPKAIDITSGQVFAQKPGDAFTMMNSHTFMNEPDGQSLTKVLQYIYHSHDKQQHFSKLDNLEMSNTWNNVVNSYAKVLEDVHARKVPAIRHRS